MRRLVPILAIVALGLCVSPASAAPVLDLDVHHTPTNFVPGGSPAQASVRTLSQGSADDNEQQELRIVAGAGAFRLSFEGDSTGDLAFDSTPAQVQGALRALPSVGGANVNVPEVSTSGSARNYRISFVKALAKTEVPAIQAESGSPPLELLAERYSFDVRNIGDTETPGPVTLTLELPAGLSRGDSAGGEFRLSDGWAEANGGVANVLWSCPGSPGDTTVTCTTSGGPIPRHTLNDALVVEVAVDPGAAGTLTATARASGGGAANVARASEPTPIDSEQAGFGILADSFVPDFFNLSAEGLAPARRSGEHPDLFTIPFDLTSSIDAVGRAVPAGNIRNVTVDLPPGFLGNPTAVDECSQALFTFGDCPPSTQVGRIDVKITGTPSPPVRIGVFNLLHPRGAVTDIAFAVVANPVHVKAALDPANRYAITTTVANINETSPALHQRVTIWGVPADPSHDSERCIGFRNNVPLNGDQDNGDTSKECSTDHERVPFITVPSECGVEHQMLLRRYDSWQESGVFGPDIPYTQPGETEECEVPRFDPEIELTPTGRQANTPTGLDVHVKVPQNENPNALATPPIKRTVVTLPEGMVLSPSFADGLIGCSEAQFGISHAGVPDGDPVACPDNSRIGEVELFSPLLPKAIVGSMYLAKQEDNPFDSLFAFYLALHDTEERGVLVKVPGRLDLNPLTGQITQTFDDLPQLPFEDLTLRFRSGERAPLVNPPTCGQHTIEVKVSSYAQPNDPVDASNTYEVREGPGGAPCAASEAARPFEPKLAGGTLNPVAGAFSPMALRVSRTDADQEIATVQGTAPAGLSASLRGVGFCPEAQIALARARSAPGEGQLERRSPSCPAYSQVGTVQTGAGAGPSPIYIPGKIYLAGPYKGAPLSGVAIVPAVAGPADLGVVVVRAPAYVDRRTAQVRIVSDPFPQIVHGVRVRVRDVRVRLDRPNFTLNPTSCQEKSLGATLTSVVGAVKSLAERFQVLDCANLGFEPRLSLKLAGGTRRGAHPALHNVYRPRAGDANLEHLVVRLPRSAFLDQAHIRTICTRVQFAADACPKAAIYGHVRVFTPLLDDPLQGPVYLRSSDNKLPDLVFDLRGLIDLEAAARIDSKNGGIRATFADVPDAPIEKVVLDMQGGKKGLIVNSRNICKGANRADGRLSAHNGRRATLRPRLRAQKCRQGRGRRNRR